MSTAGIIIVAAGNSRRMNGRDKVYLTLEGKPVLAWSVGVCQQSELIQDIVLVVRASEIEHGKGLAAEHGWTKMSSVCAGGERRQDSVREGLSRLKPCDIVLIHDGARPFLTADLIKRGLEAVAETGAAIAAVPAKDTIKMAGEDCIVNRTLERSQVWMVQTPQVFNRAIISQAYERQGDDATDDSMLVESLGHKVKLYMGDYNNIKITTSEDLVVAEAIARSIR
jgi:2-C-methyl-D-erythritol 4-phosphate cytidylyltransferase